MLSSQSLIGGKPDVGSILVLGVRGVTEELALVASEEASWTLFVTEKAGAVLLASDGALRLATTCCKRSLTGVSG